MGCDGMHLVRRAGASCLPRRLPARLCWWGACKQGWAGSSCRQWPRGHGCLREVARPTCPLDLTWPNSPTRPAPQTYKQQQGGGKRKPLTKLERVPKAERSGGSGDGAGSSRGGGSGRGEGKLGEGAGEQQGCTMWAMNRHASVAASGHSWLRVPPWRTVQGHAALPGLAAYYHLPRYLPRPLQTSPPSSRWLRL